MHAVDLVAEHARNHGYKKVLLLATKFTMEDGFFAKKACKKCWHSCNRYLPQGGRFVLQDIHGQLMRNHVTAEAREYCRDSDSQTQESRRCCAGMHRVSA